MRLPFQRSKPAAEEVPPKAARARRARRETTEALSADGAAVEAARTRARRRLVGALVLLAIGVIGFPLLFETQPRPLPVDTPIEMPARDATVAPSTQTSAERSAAPAQALPGGDADAVPVPVPGVLATAATGGTGSAAPGVSVAPTAASTPPAPEAFASSPAPSGAVVTAVRKAEVAPAEAAPASASPSAARFVVQVGAYADAGTLHDARTRVEKLGLKTYTQVIESAGGRRTRVRVGPFASRAEADSAAARVRRGGLPASVLTL